MKKVSVLYNQNLLDVAVQCQGDIRSVFEIALDNDRSITDALAIDEKLNIKTSQYENLDIEEYFRRRNQQIATASADDENINDTSDYVFPQVLPFIL